jgi:hypothetical protein
VGLIVGVAALAAATIAGVIVGQGKRSPTTTSPGQSLVLTSPAAFVTHSAQRTLAERTVDLTMSGTVPFGGKNVAAYGTGELNFGTNSMAFDMHMTTPSGSLDEKTVLINGNLYYALTVDGTSFTKLVGRTWIQTPVQQSAAASLAGSDPLSSLSVLEQQGSIIRQLGSKTIDGVTCTGYAVTPSRQAMVTETREQDAQQGVSASATEQDVQQAQDTPPPTIIVWADGLGLVHELSINLPINVQGASASGGAMDMDFTHFGGPVSITAPPPADTISYPAFLKALSNKSALRPRGPARRRSGPAARRARPPRRAPPR